MKQKHGFLLFLTSCVPGCGQMYQGYMKRGISLMMALCILFILPMFLRLDYLLIFMVPLWLFSFFDSYNLRSLMEQSSAEPDAWLFGLSDIDSEKLILLCRQRHSFIGWALVILGTYALFDTFVGRLMNELCEYLDNWFLYEIIMRDLPRMVVTIFIIALGMWFIRGPKKSKPDDIPIFTPPADSAAPQAEPESSSQAEQETPSPAEQESPIQTEQEDSHGDE